MKIKHLAPAGLAVAIATYVSVPEQTKGYSLIGDNLSLSQRDFRVYNNFEDFAANSNTVEHEEWPGYDGAELAIWKACVEWGSRLHGNGNGDPHQVGDLGSGGANFDPSFQGNATGVGQSSHNIHSALPGNGGSVLAYAETGFGSFGSWRIRYYENWNWGGGPWATSNTMDLQGIATHEYGHALGLGHSAVSNTTMFASASGNGAPARTIESDDIDGVQAIYGAASGSKPIIDRLEDGGGSNLIIHGSNFSGSNNEVWFTQAGIGGNGQPIKVTGVSSTNGGTRISVTVPGSAGDGDVLVKSSGSSHNDLSNAYPYPFYFVPLPPCEGYFISSITPDTVGSVQPFSGQNVTVSGCGFDQVTSVSVDGNVLAGFPPAYSIVNEQTITLEVPLLTSLGPVDVTLNGPSGQLTTTLTIIEPEPPVQRLENGADEELLFSITPIDVVVGGEVGNVAFIMASGVLEPTIVPGVFTADIGDNFTNLFLLGDPLIIGSFGYAEAAFNFAGLPPSILIHFQSFEYDVPTGELPVVSTNVSTGQWLF